MKERIGYGVGDFANNMMYTPVNSFFTYFLTNVAGLGARTWRRCGWNHSSDLPSPGRRQRPDRWLPDGYAVLYIAAIIKGVGNAALSGVMYGMLADTVEYNDWKSGIRAEGLVFSANSIGQKIGSGIGSAVLGWVLAAFGFVSSSAAQPASAISGIRVIFLYVPLVVFAIMFIILLFYKLDKEYGHIVEDLEKRAKRA